MNRITQLAACVRRHACRACFQSRCRVAGPVGQACLFPASVGLTLVCLASAMLLGPARTLSSEDKPAPATEPAATTGPAAATEPALKQLGALIETYCIDCHDAIIARGGIDLEAMLVQEPLVKSHDHWMNVMQRVSDGDMPPAKSPQPTDAQRQAIGQLLDELVVRFDYATVAHPGHETIRRLSHREYGNTVRDLLGVEFDALASFPPELVGASGFDNSVNSLFLQRGQMERYLTTAENLVDQALPKGADAAQWRRVIGDKAQALDPGPEQVNAAIAHFLPRAYRRPPTQAELDQAMAHYRLSRERGLDHEQSLRAMITSILVEAPFLLRMEAPPERVLKPGEPTPISPYELANRLSYFLWASMPDDELFDAAGEEDPRRRLDDPAVLQAQIDRMLKDPKAVSLGTDFASQWLGFTHLGSRRRPDPIDHPQFTDSLYEAMRMESALVFYDLILEDRPLTQAIVSDHTFVNEELARYYGWPDIHGDEMRRVQVPDKRRGGFLTQASILMVTAFPDRTSPVVRGNWVLSELLGTPPPPPPANAAQFSDEIEEANVSIERKMQLHRQQKSCAGCHNRIDPLGLALENYDHFGRWREASRAKGVLPEGVAFSGPEAFKAVLLETRMGDLNRQLARKMLSYALGRQLSYTDEHDVRVIAEKVAASGYRSRTLIQAVVQSNAFRFQQVPAEIGEP